MNNFVNATPFRSKSAILFKVENEIQRDVPKTTLLVESIVLSQKVAKRRTDGVHDSANGK